MNVYYLDEIFEYFSSKKLYVNPNMLHLPWQLNMKVLPQAVKDAVVAKLLAYTPDQPYQVGHWEAMKNMVIAFLNTPADGTNIHFREFHRYTRGLDQNRNQSFETALPEFSKLIKPYFDQLDKSTGRSGVSVDSG